MKPKEELAIEIANKLKKCSAPGNCTWGDQFPDAHLNLFRFYFDDIVSSIKDVLDKSDL